MFDGVGTTTYTYKAPGQPDAGSVDTIDGPLTDDTLAYTYDALGRATSEINLLGTFCLRL